MKARLCPECKEYKSGYFCDKCGTKLKDLPQCKCSASLLRSDTYCSNCGKKVPEKLYYGWPIHARPSITVGKG